MKIKRNLLSIALTIGFTLGGAGVASAADMGTAHHGKRHGHAVACVKHHHHCRYPKACGFAGLCGWPYASGGTVYFAEGNGWPFGCNTGNAGGWPYYYGVGVAGTPGGVRYGFAYSFRPYAICRQSHGVRFCRRHWQDFTF